MTKSITIIGAGGKMGKWFSAYFLNNGFEVTGHDSEKPVLKTIINSDSLIGSILKADYVLLSTPTKKTPEIIRLISKEMKRGACLIDLSLIHI